MSYTVQSAAQASLEGETTIKVALEQNLRGTGQFTEIKTLNQTAHEFSTAGEFHYNGGYTPETPNPEGRYRVKLEVTAPNGAKELTRYQEIYYSRGGIQVAPGPVEPSRWLEPGKTYIIPIRVNNISSNHDYHIKNRICILHAEKCFRF